MKLIVLFFTIITSASAACTFNQEDAQGYLEGAGVAAYSSGNCVIRSNPRCTSYEGIRCSTVFEVADLKALSECDITITGGTEVGHAPGPHSHAKGYAVNLRKNKCVDAYIRRKYKRSGVCWVTPLGNKYCNQNNRWDATYIKSVYD